MINVPLIPTCRPPTAPSPAPPVRKPASAVGQAVVWSLLFLTAVCRRSRLEQREDRAAADSRRPVEPSGTAACSRLIRRIPFVTLAEASTCTRLMSVSLLPKLIRRSSRNHLRSLCLDYGLLRLIARRDDPVPPKPSFPNCNLLSIPNMFDSLVSPPYDPLNYRMPVLTLHGLVLLDRGRVLEQCTANPRVLR